MSVLGQGSGSDYPTSVDTAEQQVDGASGTLADANWANDVTSAITAIEGELGTDPAGSLSTVSARLSTLIATAGGITSGTTANRPTAATGTYRLYWNTTLNQLELIKDDASVTAITGVTDHGGLTGLTDDDHTIYSLATGARKFTGSVTIEAASPRINVSGTEGSGKIYSLYETAGVLYLQENTGSLGSPSYTTRLQINLANGYITHPLSELQFKNITITDSNDTNAWNPRTFAASAIKYFMPSAVTAAANGSYTTWTDLATIANVPFPFWSKPIRDELGYGATKNIYATAVMRDNADKCDIRLAYVHMSGTNYSNTVAVRSGYASYTTGYITLMLSGSNFADKATITVQVSGDGTTDGNIYITL